MTHSKSEKYNVVHRALGHPGNLGRHTLTHQHTTGLNIGAAPTQDMLTASDIPETTDYKGSAVSTTSIAHRSFESFDLSNEENEVIQRDTKRIVSFGTGSDALYGRAKRSAVSLSRFLRETEKRRCINLDDIIGLS